MEEKFRDPRLNELFERMMRFPPPAQGMTADPTRAKYEARLYALESLVEASTRHTEAITKASAIATAQAEQTALFVKAMTESAQASNTLSRRLYALNIILVIATLLGSIGTIAQVVRW
jgi:ferric-dicitrate binding protein FerR (iron transport regulator)